MDKSLYQKNKFGLYLFNRGETAYDFVKYARISINTVYKMLQGAKIKKSTAKRAIRATKKYLTLEDFGYEDKKVESRRSDRPSRVHGDDIFRIR